MHDSKIGIHAQNGIKVQQYYNPERQALEHFRFPQIFLRQTKKAYISYLSMDNYQWIANFACKPLPYYPYYPYTGRHNTGL